MIPRRSTQMRKKTRSTLTWTCSLKLKSNRRPNPHRMIWTRRCSLAQVRMMKMTMRMRRKFQALTIQTSMQTCPCLRSSRKCLSIFSATSPKRSSSTQRSSHSSQTTSQLSEKLMPSWRCQSLMAKRKTLVSLFWMSLVWIMKTKLFSSSSTFRARMSQELHPSMSTRLKALTRNLEKFLVGSAAYKTCTRHDLLPR